MAREVKLSATRIGSFLQCKQKYWFNYVDHLPKLANPVFRLGLAVHESLELAGNIWQKKEKFTATDQKKILKRYDEVSVQEGIEDMSIHLEGKELVKKRLNDFDLGKIVGLELEFGTKDDNDICTADGIPLIGAIDKVVEVDEDTLLIVDYKTSKTAPTPDQLKTDNQLSIYDLVGSLVYPQYKRIIVSLDLLKHDIMYSYRTAEERQEFSNYLKELYTQMSALKQEDAKPTLNTFCGWCDYKDYCSLYKNACERTDYAFKDPTTLDDKTLLEEWQRIRNTKRTLEQREIGLSSLLMDKIKAAGTNLQIEDTELYIRQNNRKSYDIKTVAETIPHDHFVELVNLNTTAVNKYMIKNPSVKERVNKSMNSSFTRPFLSTKKIKKTKEK